MTCRSFLFHNPTQEPGARHPQTASLAHRDPDFDGVPSCTGANREALCSRIPTILTEPASGCAIGARIGVDLFDSRQEGCDEPLPFRLSHQTPARRTMNPSGLVLVRVGQRSKHCCARSGIRPAGPFGLAACRALMRSTRPGPAGRCHRYSPTS